MKYVKIIAAVAVLLVSCAVSFYIGRSQYNQCYEDACHMSDLIRCYKSHLYSEDSVIEDYGCFEELEGTFLCDDSTGKPVDLLKYVWGY